MISCYVASKHQKFIHTVPIDVSGYKLPQKLSGRANSHWVSAFVFEVLRSLPQARRRIYCVGSVDSKPVKLPHSNLPVAHSPLACSQHPRRAGEGRQPSFGKDSLNRCKGVRFLFVLSVEVLSVVPLNNVFVVGFYLSKNLIFMKQWLIQMSNSFWTDQNILSRWLLSKRIVKFCRT